MCLIYSYQTGYQVKKKKKLITFNRLRETINIPDANPQVSNSISLLLFTLSTDINWNNVIQTIAKYAVNKFGFVCFAR